MCKQLLIICCLTFTLISCQTNRIPDLTNIQRKEIADSIKQQNQALLITLLKKNSYDQWISHWLKENEDFWTNKPATMVNNCDIVPTFKEIEEIFRPALANRASTKNSILSDHIAVLSNNIAIQVYETEYSVTSLEGKSSPYNPVTVTILWIKQKGEWKIFHYHQSWTTNIQDSP